MTNQPVNVGARFRVPLSVPFQASACVLRLLAVVSAQGGAGVLVGGCVRDHLLGIKAKDIDIEVYGIDKDRLEQILTLHFSVVAVGKSFGIFKVTVIDKGERETIDVSLPRSENKEGSGHKGFVVTTDPHMPFEQASARRDFTINAMGIDVATNELIDPHGGFSDLRAHRLKHVSAAFSEDPLRVLRAAQFCARFALTLDPDTVTLCRTLRDELLTLSKERIFEEFQKASSCQPAVDRSLCVASS